MLQAIERIDYYRLLAYMRPLQVPDAATGTRQFLPGTTMDDVLALYEFDRQLRLLCMDAVERIEVALRAAIVSEVAVKHGAHFYMDRAHFTSDWGYDKFLEAVREEAGRHASTKHYYATYDSPSSPPIWIAMEGVTLGTLSHLFSNLIRKRRREIATRFNFDEGILRSWFRSVNLVRNVAAHHGRLWNAALTVDKPRPGGGLDTEFPTQIENFFARAVVIVALLDRIGRATVWKAQLRELMDRNPNVDEAHMGFLPNWRERPFWSIPSTTMDESSEKE